MAKRHGMFKFETKTLGRWQDQDVIGIFYLIFRTEKLTA